MRHHKATENQMGGRHMTWNDGRVVEWLWLVSIVVTYVQYWHECMCICTHIYIFRLAGDLIWQVGPHQIYAAPLDDGSRGVVMFNQHTKYTQYPGTKLWTHACCTCYIVWCFVWRSGLLPCRVLSCHVMLCYVLFQFAFPSFVCI